MDAQAAGSGGGGHRPSGCRTVPRGECCRGDKARGPTIANGNPPMIRNRSVRRSVAVALMVLGALLMLLAPPVWVGAIPLALGVLLEVAGIVIEHGDEK